MRGVNGQPRGTVFADSVRVLVNRSVAPGWGSCTYLVRTPDSGDAVVIDPGTTAAASLKSMVQGSGAERVLYIILTHEHFDHIAGADVARATFGAELVCSAACARALGDPKLNMSFYSGSPVQISPPDWVCEKRGWTVPWKGGAIELVRTPGHSPGSLCVAIGDALFTGDTLLGNQRTPTHLPGGDKSVLQQSIRRLLSQFDGNTMAYPGHGDEFLLGDVDPRRVLGS